MPILTEETNVKSILFFFFRRAGDLRRRRPPALRSLYRRQPSDTVRMHPRRTVVPACQDIWTTRWEKRTDRRVRRSNDDSHIEICSRRVLRSQRKPPPPPAQPAEAWQAVDITSETRGPVRTDSPRPSDHDPTPLLLQCPRTPERYLHCRRALPWRIRAAHGNESRPGMHSA